MSRIFISYKRVDKDKVFKIKNQIESALGEKCWIDLHGIESTDIFASKIIGAINSCEVFLFMYSKAHKEIIDYENDWTIRELNFAQEKKKRIVFINTDGSELTDWFKLLFGTKQHVDGKSQDAISRLTTDMRRWLDIDKPIVSSREPHIESSKHVFSFKTISKNKGRSIAITVAVAFVLCIVVLPLGYLTFGGVGNTNDNKAGKNCLNSSNPSFTGQPDRNDGGVTAAPPIDKIEFVDLGLPSQTMWADRNIGARKKSDYGNLYSWGETSIKTDYRQSCYINIDTNNIVGSKYDVATQVCGHSYQMPTQKQFDELIKECRWEWSGNGYNIIGKNGNSISLPATGWSCSSAIEHRDVYGYYWTGNRYNSDFAKGLLFSKSEKKTGNGYLYYCRAIRPVRR